MRMEGTVCHASPDGRWLISANVTAMRKTQPGYGVRVPDEIVRRNIGPAADDGFYLTDTSTGKSRLLASIRDLLTKADPPVRGFRDARRSAPGVGPHLALRDLQRVCGRYAEGVPRGHAKADAVSWSEIPTVLLTPRGQRRKDRFAVLDSPLAFCPVRRHRMGQTAKTRADAPAATTL